jgi:alkaline phosphatase
MQHATDSAPTAGCLATGHKASVNMLSVDLYEEDVSTLVEDAMMCGKAGGVVTSVPLLHATPAAFVTHSNSRANFFQLQKSFEAVNPTYAAGTCATGTQPSEAHKKSMLPGGPLASAWTFLYQGKDNATAANFYDPIQNLDPDDGKHVMVCFGGQYTKSNQPNMPYRGLDSTYTNRWCSSGADVKNAAGNVTGVKATTNSTLCNHYSPAEVAQIPKMAKTVEEALKFLAKDNDGFFVMYEQGDVSFFLLTTRSSL